MDLKNVFCLLANLSDNDIISAKSSGLKTGVKNDVFWSEIGSGFEEPGGTPHQEFPGVPRRDFKTFQIISKTHWDSSPRIETNVQNL